MSQAFSPSHLRLVGSERLDGRPSWHEIQRSRLAVTKENRLAAHAPGLDPHDPRWVLAMQTQVRLQGTMLTPERRDQLLRSGAKLGLRPFEANLVMAIVQDRARAGLPASKFAPMLKLVGETCRLKPRAEPTWPKWLAAFAAAAALCALMARFFLW